MLAPTRDLVAAAQPARPSPPPAPDRRPDGAGGAPGRRQHRARRRPVITRSNDRRLRLSATDWVKNGDRWTVPAVAPDGAPDGAAHPHRATGHPARRLRRRRPPSSGTPPPSTAPKASPPTPCTAWPPAPRSRQQLYTMLTRGAAANHLYLQVVGDGDPHTVIRPENVHPADRHRPPREHPRPRRRPRLRHHHCCASTPTPPPAWADAAARYLDALHVAAEHHLGPRRHRRARRRRRPRRRPASPTTPPGPPCAPT